MTKKQTTSIPVDIESSFSDAIDRTIINLFCNREYDNSLKDAMIDNINDMLLCGDKKCKKEVNKIINALNKYDEKTQKHIKNAVFINQLK